jgi:pyruvate/2-oxoglutarate dehydrogenase complex dihydrolipoamide acyltransferase (E2) component
LSVALATLDNLVTPVLRNAVTMVFLHIGKGDVDLDKKARGGKLAIE